MKFCLHVGKAHDPKINEAWLYNRINNTYSLIYIFIYINEILFLIKEKVKKIIINLPPTSVDPILPSNIAEAEYSITVTF